MCKFLTENILTRFGTPSKIVTDNAQKFSSREIQLHFYDHGVHLSHSSNYSPQGNGHAESINKNLVNIMKKLGDEKGKDWHKKLYEVVWADRTSPKRAIGMTPFELVYRVEAQLSLPLELATLNLQKEIEDEMFQSSIEKRVLYLQKIEEERRELVDHITNHQARVKRIFDQKARP